MNEIERMNKVKEQQQNWIDRKTTWRTNERTCTEAERKRDIQTETCDAFPANLQTMLPLGTMTAEGEASR